MKLCEYTQLRGKSRSWVYNVLRSRGYAEVIDMEVLVNEIGQDVFMQLVREVKGEKDGTH